ncbi:MAG: FAD-dependent thymidylate synthase [Spirochaetales bacterium]|nr:FAD-dependent thymidylate synthase [Spirochaetales bacterium]
MARIVVPEAEAVLDQEFKVLDKGFVRLVDYLGGDARIVQAARVSYGAGTKSFREDKGLIDYLLRHQHTSPFEQVSLTFHCKMPIFVARQWVRHRTAKLNEISGRYSVMHDDFYVPEASAVSYQSLDNKQGRSESEVPPEIKTQVQTTLAEGQIRAYEEYKKLLDLGLARELARINLPLSLYTEWYWTMDLHNLFRFLALRLDAHAQLEIRRYAEVILDLTRQVAPVAVEAFENHLLGGVQLSRQEVLALRRVAEQQGESFSKVMDETLEGKARERFWNKLQGHGPT